MSVLTAALPALEFLNVVSPGIFPALEQFDLPALRHLVLGEWLEVVKRPTFQVKNEDVEEWGRFLDSSAWGDFPALREIKAMPFNWPTDEHGISRSPWVKWAEGLLKKEVKLTDESGKHWTPRFKGASR
ncbi:hypothetical protein FB451DRAFT_1411262 [Mycena latifolia]|nr:hypothetical protein FB451DRAFT_1411262 [Mycena latifolia]